MAVQTTREGRTMLKLGVNVRWLRQKKGITQVELARKAGVDQSYLSDIELGRRGCNPSMIVVSRVAHALGVSVQTLCTNIH